MKLVCASFGLEMELLENYVTVLVVENAGYLTEIVSSLKKQSEGSEGEEGIFVLAENDKIEKIVEEYVYNLGNSAEVGAKYIVQAVQEQIKKAKEQ